MMSYHDSRMFPLGKLVEDAKEVDAAKAISPAVGWRVPDLQGLGRQLGLFADHARRKIQKCNTVGDKEMSKLNNVLVSRIKIRFIG